MTKQRVDLFSLLLSLLLSTVLLHQRQSSRYSILIMCITYTNQLTGVLYLEINFFSKKHFFETWRLLNISDHLQSVFWSDLALITSWFRNLYTALQAMFNIAMTVAMVVCSPKVHLQNAFSRRFARWCRLTKTTRILHFFCFLC